MAPFIPPPTKAPSHQPQADTIKKTRFFEAIDNRSDNVIIKHVYEQENIKHATGKNWLTKRKCLNYAAYRRGDKTHDNRRKAISFEIMNRMFDFKQNSVRDCLWFIQIEHFDLEIVRRTMQQTFNQHRFCVSRFKKIRVCTFSKKNKKLRVQYERKHQDYIISNYSQYVHWSDEAHFDSDQMYEKRVLRKKNLI